MHSYGGQDGKCKRESSEAPEFAPASRIAPLLRISIQPDSENGLQKLSQIMIDKALAVKRDKIGQAFGSISADTLLEIERCLAVFLGVAK